MKLAEYFMIRPLRNIVIGNARIALLHNSSPSSFIIIFSNCGYKSIIVTFRRRLALR